MIEGFYAVYYTGQAGTGFGILVLNDGDIVGADVVGSRYDGRYGYVAQNKAYEGTVTMTVPANTPLVTGQAPQTEPYHVDFPISFPEANVQAEQPVVIQLPTGPVNVVLKKLRDL